MARNTRKWKRLAGEVGATLVEQLVGAIHESAHRVREQEEQAALDGDEDDEVEEDDVDSVPRAQHWGGFRWRPPPGASPNFSGRGSKQSTNRTQGSGRREPPRPPPADSAPPKKTPYDILGVKEGHPLRVYEKLYQTLSEFSHPDKGGSAEQQAELNAAIKSIRDELKKKK